MFAEKEIEQIIHQKIRNDETLGEQTGGSGHLGFVTYRLKDYSVKQLAPDRVEITYTYCKYTETEFTCYPDNPPCESQHTRRIVINSNKEIEEEG